MQLLGQPQVIDFKELEEEVRMIVGGILPIARVMLARIRQPLAPAPNLNVDYILSQKAVANSKLCGRLLRQKFPLIFSAADLAAKLGVRPVFVQQIKVAC
ncbi:hypothetical protein KHC17_24960 (plasmid) [Agrobacterium salinitolerans]|uniref:hypothetical protein n=1 Tax=Agrobacterium salinitolerans TaxID=1183413 RepID=UPI001C21DD0B|nr:hypothetical protein [Agrobacterium salinitolerans]QXC52503.1 hypothetical protein KHC17_24960 [Agrobacterium salinitolerans]